MKVVGGGKQLSKPYYSMKDSLSVFAGLTKNLVVKQAHQERFLSCTHLTLHLCVLVAVSEEEEEGFCRPVQRCGGSGRKGDQWTDTSDEWRN